MSTPKLQVLGNLVGDSAYQIALKNGFDGTETEWLESLKGKQGKQGVQGVQGEAGKPFAIAKTYPSTKAMHADIINTDIPIGAFVLIVSDPNDKDNAKLFCKTEKPYGSGIIGETALGALTLGSEIPTNAHYAFVVDMSGAQGEAGKSLTITKIYPSTKAMHADASNPNIPIGVFVLADSKIYCKGEKPYGNGVIGRNALGALTLGTEIATSTYYAFAVDMSAMQFAKPVKGVDYWTEADKRELLNELKAMWSGCND